MATTKLVTELNTADLGRLLDAGDGAVVILKAGETQLVAHRAVLEAWSHGFSTLFGQDESRSQYEVTNVEGPVLRELVSYCYTLRAPHQSRMGPELLEGADKYGLPGLKNACEQQLTAQLAVENAAACGVLALRHSCSDLEQAAVALIKVHTQEVLQTQSWEDTALRYPHHALELLRRVILEPGARQGRSSNQSEGDPVLRLLLAFCDTLQATHPPKMAAQLLEVANKYDLWALKGARKPQAVPQLAVEIAVPSAVVALRHSCSDLEQAAVALIKSHTQEVLTAQSWEHTALRYPHHLLQLFLRVIRELPAGTRSTPTTEPSSDVSDDGRQTPEEAAAADAPPLPAAASRFRCLSGEEKARRLIQAAQHGATNAMQALLAVGADVAATDAAGLTALHWAAFEGQAEAARLLLEAGARPGATTGGGDCALHLAVMGGHAAVVRLLLAAGAHPDTGNRGGRTPLHLAAWWGRAEAAAALLSAGADRRATDSDGRTPAHYARLYGRRQLLEMLR